MARRGLSPVAEPGVEAAFRQGLEEGRFEATLDGVEASRRSVVKFLTVPVGYKRGVDLTALLEAARTVGQGLKRGDLVVVCPTVPPGTTEGPVREVLEGVSGLRVEEDFGLGYWPERLAEGRAIRDIEEAYPLVVAGAGPRSLQALSRLLEGITHRGVLQASSIRVAELEKVLEGIYRDVNIALANELAHLASALGVDFYEAQELANSQPYCHLHRPGVGVGGACIPLYPRFLIDRATELGLPLQLTALARAVNEAQPLKALQLLKAALEAAGRPLPGSRIALLGLAFRGGVADTRESPTYVLVGQLLAWGCRVVVHDPLVREDPTLDNRVHLTPVLEEALKGADAVLLVTDHPQYRGLGLKDLQGLVRAPPVVVDGRGILDPARFQGAVFRAVGRPSQP
jgi:hypothetical protein